MGNSKDEMEFVNAGDGEEGEEEEDNLHQEKPKGKTSSSPFKKPAPPKKDKNEDEHVGNNKGESAGGVESVQPSPTHSWISNSSSCTNLFEDEEMDEEYEGGGGEDDYEYDPYTHEYVPKIKESPAGEDSDDGLLVSKTQRNASLSFVAQALLDSARANQERWEKEQEDQRVGTTSCFAKLLFSTGKALCAIEEMPKHLQFNQYILSGYRKLGNAWSCVKSLGYLHNETLNILTHVAPILYVLLYWRTLFPWGSIQGNTFLNLLGCSHVAACIAPWIGSVIYHLFMNHDEGGEPFYQVLLQIDMFGIWVTECFGALTNLIASGWCLPHSYQTAIMTAYGLAALWGLQHALTAWTPWGRRMCFAPVFLSRIFAFGLRLSPWGGGNPNVLADVILQDFLSIAGGIIGVVRIPEKWFPGRLDLWLNSHHIMHIMVVWAVTHMNAAANGDVQWIINNYDQKQCPLLIPQSLI